MLAALFILEMWNDLTLVTVGGRLEAGRCPSEPPEDGGRLGLAFSVSDSFSRFRGAIKRIVFLFLNSVFLPKTAFSNETLSTEE